MYLNQGGTDAAVSCRHWHLVATNSPGFALGQTQLLFLQMNLSLQCFVVFPHSKTEEVIIFKKEKTVESVSDP